MIIFKKAKPLTAYLLNLKKENKKIGFVPTMGALHEGHLSLLREASKNNDYTICSIFVNPTQFNNPEDFKHYPKTIEKDIEQLVLSGCKILFLPHLTEIYHRGYQKKHYNLGPIENILEGFYRPGHFQGVSEVVDRLMQIVSPHNLYLGQKDFQQCMVIKKLMELTGRENEIQLVVVPTLREKNGLAMSSRNLRLDQNEKELATSIYNELMAIKNRLTSSPFEQLKKTAVLNLENIGFQVDYFEIANRETLATANTPNEPLVALVAATLGKVRLIDNLILN